jgi:hypothetical protein
MKETNNEHQGLCDIRLHRIFVPIDVGCRPDARIGLGARR